MRLVASTLALASCGAGEAPEAAPAGPVRPLKSVAPFPVGTAASTIIALPSIRKAKR